MATTLNSDQSFELTYLSGLEANGTIAATSFETWKGDTPATYATGSVFVGKWGSGTAGAPAMVSYSFTAASNWTATEKGGFVAALALWSAETGLTFNQVASGGQLSITRATNGGADGGTSISGSNAIGSSHLGRITSGSVNIDTSVASFGPIGGSFTNYGGYPWTTVFHEIGHAIGLGHSGAYGTGGTVTALTAYDSRAWAVMSYIDPSDASVASAAPSGGFHWGTDLSDNGGYYGGAPTTPMMLDILAAQRLYGLPVSTPLSGGQIFGFNTNISGDIRPFFDFTVNTKPIVTLWDAGTGNTLDLSGYATASTVDLHDGHFSSVAGLTNNLGIGVGVAIDTLVLGAGADSVVANDNGDTIRGGGGNDRIVGGAGNDMIEGGDGADTLTGGGGADTFRGTVAEMNGDRITDLAIGDRIDVTDSNLANFAYARSGATLRFGATSMDVGNGNLRLVLSADGNGTDLVAARHWTALNDFDGNGHSDLLWRNDNGTLTTWQASGNGRDTQFAMNSFADNSVSTAWKVAETFDFNGDGQSDVLWRNTQSGAFTIWDGAAGHLTKNVYGDASVGTDWSIAAVGDLNGDGRDDIVWRQSGGALTTWLSTGTGFVKNAYGDTSVSTDWQIVGLGDFNGDGKADLLWRNQVSGAFTEWSSNGSGFNKNSYGDSSVDTSWHIAAIADFNGDGKDDLLWRHDGDGAMTVWQATDTGFHANTYLNNTVSPDWQVATTGDFNDDGKADIVWRNVGGGATVWQSTGNGFDANTATISGVDTTWHLAAHDYHFG